MTLKCIAFELYLSFLSFCFFSFAFFVYMSYSLVVQSWNITFLVYKEDENVLIRFVTKDVMFLAASTQFSSKI